MKIVLAVSFCTFRMLYSFGQSAQEAKMKYKMDSIKAAYLDAYAWKNPILRQAGISTDVFAPGDMKSDLNGSAFFKSNYKAVRTNAYFSVPVLHKGKNIFSANFSASHQTLKLYDVTSYDAALPLGTTEVQNTLISTAFTYTRIDSLFHRPAIYSLSASTLVDPQSGLYRFGFTGVMTLSLIQTNRTLLSLGLMLLIDPTVPVPVIPFVSFSHKFKSPGLEFFLDPSRIALRKEINPRNSLALSNNIGGNVSLFKREITNLPIRHAYTTMEMKSGLIYEHLMTKKMVFSLSAGVSSTFTSKVLDGNKFTDPFIKNTQSMVPYVRAGISFLPFWKGLFIKEAYWKVHERQTVI